MASVIRLYVDHPLGVGQSVPLNREQSHYLFGVMRRGVGEVIELFNGIDGEWLARVVQAGKRNAILLCESKSKPMMLPPDLWMMFAPIKKVRTDFIVEKATEMGAAQILPVQTDFTNSERIRQDRLQNHAVEAAEQCGGTYVPPVMELQKLSKLLDGWDDRHIMFCDENRLGEAVALPQQPGPWAILIGPEGGFSPAERERLEAMPQAQGVSLGPRILRADTAAVAALALWQTSLGDWQ
ncbi:16S rRNA (uracil(1498)-N(3))-methyltransferase [uncultured Planktomarina sp.]|uniref:16S rRNA (uracil(1498)-N(3))-methyltransferase n=1 Tax=uncultured Planktomarina sp. TaxID=1538529 RepID=UPI003260CCE4